jgi:hypothetical protein
MHITPHHRSPIQAPNHLGENQARWDYLKTTAKARLSILILSKTYPTKRKYDRHARLFGCWVCFAKSD